MKESEMDSKQTIFSKNLDKLVEDYTSYKNMCEEFKMTRKLEKKNFKKAIRPLTLNLSQRSSNKYFSKDKDDYMPILFEDSSTHRSEESTEVSTPCSRTESLQKKEDESAPNKLTVCEELFSETPQKPSSIEENMETTCPSNKSNQFPSKKFSLTDIYEEKINEKSAQIQKEINELKATRSNEMDEALLKIQTLEKALNDEKRNNEATYSDLVLHYDNILQKMGKIHKQITYDYDNVGRKMFSLKEQVQSIHDELRVNLNDNFASLFGVNSLYDIDNPPPSPQPIDFLLAMENDLKNHHHVQFTSDKDPEDKVIRNMVPLNNSEKGRVKNSNEKGITKKDKGKFTNNQQENHEESSKPTNFKGRNVKFSCTKNHYNKPNNVLPAKVHCSRK